MRIAIIAPGSQGDVEPYLALGKGLRRLRAPVNGLACRPRQRAADLGFRIYPERDGIAGAVAVVEQIEERLGA